MSNEVPETFSTAVVTSKSNTYNGVTIYERQIADLVGMDTYASLYFLFPDLYYPINYPMTPKEYAVQNIQSVQVNSGYLPFQIKQKLVEAIVTKDPDPNILPLIDSSPPPKNWNSDFFSTAWFVFFVSLFVVLFLWVIYIFLLAPIMKDYV